MGAESLYISSVLAAGFLSFFSPCVVPLLPVYFSIFSAGEDSDDKKVVVSRAVQLWKTFLFVLGISVCFVILGFGAGALGSVINSKSFLRVMGGIVVILGIHQTGLINIKWLQREKKLNLQSPKGHGYLSVFFLGLSFSFGWTPCIGPVLGAVLAVSANTGQSYYGGLLMAVYSLGFMVPFMILAFFSNTLLRKVGHLNKYLGKIKIAGGIIIIIMGLLLMTDKLGLLYIR